MLSDTEKSLRFPLNTGYLRMASSNVLCKHFLMPYLKEFSNLYPNTDIAITCTSSVEACRMMEECRIDLALVVRPENLGGAIYHSLGVIEYIKNALNIANNALYLDQGKQRETSYYRPA